MDSSAASAHSQENNASIEGTVLDNTGAAIPDAAVQLKNNGTGELRGDKSDAQGNYNINLLGPGRYTVSVSANGFKMYTVSDLTLATGDHARIDAKLDAGSVTQSVSVEAGIAGVLQTDSSNVGGLVTNTAVEDLPVNGRNVIRLVQLIPGANEGDQNSISNGSRPDDRRLPSAISANGQNTQLNNFLLDGLDNNERILGALVVRPSIDALQEVRVDTSTYNAELGRVGGAVIQMVTKSGTNEFHGSAFEFVRNDIFDAKNYFNVHQTGNPLAGVKPEFRQNQFGGSIGGPIRKNGLFFFGDYEGLRIIQGTTISTIIPTACELGRSECNGITQLGNFSDLATTIYDPATLAPFPGNVIPLASISPIAVNYSALYPTLPASACPNATCTYVNSPKRTQFQDTADTRIDQHWSPSDITFGRYSINNTNTYTPGPFPDVKVAGVNINPGGPDTNTFVGPAHQRTQSLALGHTHIFSQNVLFQGGAQVLRYAGLTTAANAGTEVNNAFGGPANANSSVRGTDGLALLQFSGAYSTLGDSRALPVDYWDTSYVYNGAVSWTKGNHNFKFGSSLTRRDFSSFQILYKASFAFAATETNSKEGGKGGTGGNAFASLLAGYPHQDVRIVGLTAPQYRTWEIGEFAQDNWHVNRILTLNLGLRWDLFTPTTEKHNLISNFDPTDPATLAGGQVIVAGTNGVSRSINIRTEYRDFQPRLGFAAALNHGFVVRGGFGTSYYTQNENGNANLKNQPFVNNYTLNQTPGGGAGLIKFTDPLPAVTPQSTCLVAACGAAPTPSLPSFSVSAGVVQNFHWTNILMFNLFAEKEIRNTVLTVGYVGELDRHLGRGFTNYDEPLPPQGPGGCGVTTAIKLPNPCQQFYSQLPLVSSLLLTKTDGVSNYSALQTAFQHRYRAGLTLSGNYTFSHTLSNATGTASVCSGCGLIYNNPGYDYGPADYDIRNRVALTGNYQLPFGDKAHGLTALLNKGWAVNGIYAYSSGQPFTALSSVPQINVGASQDRPNKLASQQGFKRSLTQWFDTTEFQQQTFGTAGSESRNPLRGPRLARFDFSLFKNVDLTERVKLQLRAETFNLTNTPSFGLPNATIAAYSGGVATTGGNFGKITTTNVFYTPRDLQLAAKIIF